VLARSQPTRQTARKGRLNFLYPNQRAITRIQFERFIRETPPNTALAHTAKNRSMKRRE